jgi:hypothetical protein
LHELVLVGVSRAQFGKKHFSYGFFTEVESLRCAAESTRCSDESLAVLELSGATPTPGPCAESEAEVSESVLSSCLAEHAAQMQMDKAIVSNLKVFMVCKF